MLVCPNCAFPVENDLRVMSVSNVVCVLCGHRCESSDLVRYRDDAKIVNPKVFVELMQFFTQAITPQIGGKLVELGIMSADPSLENIAAFTKLLIKISRASFQAVLEGVLIQDDEEHVLGGGGSNTLQ